MSHWGSPGGDQGDRGRPGRDLGETQGRPGGDPGETRERPGETRGDLGETRGRLHEYYNLTKFHQNQIKNKKILLLGHFL